VIITCALEMEAKPIISHYKLRKRPLVPIWENSDIILAVTGSSLIYAALGVAKVGKSGGKFLNIGIGGHKNFEIGTPLIANKIHFEHFIEYPQIIFTPPCKTHSIRTVLKPENTYPDHNVYEMEGYGFFKAALTFTDCELITLLKIISDNKLHPIKELSKNTVSILIEQNFNIIEKTIEALQNLPCSSPPVDLSPFLTKTHFTESQTLKLKRLLERARALKIPKDDTLFETKYTSDQILKTLEDKVTSTELKL